MTKVLVQITSTDPVRYSLDNGVTLSEFEPHKVYEVPDYVGKGMVKRKWAKHVTTADLETQDAAETEIDLGELHETAQGVEAEDESDDEDEDEENEGGEHQPARRPTKPKRKKTRSKR